MKRVLSLLLLSAHTVCGETVDLQGLIDARIAKGEKHIILPAGRYEVAPQKGVHLRFDKLTDVTIEAAGVEMVCMETTQAVAIESCTNLVIRGLTIDYDPLPFTQGRIIKIAENRKSHIIEIMDGFPPAESAIVSKHAVYSAEGQLKFGNYYDFELKPLPGNRLEISQLNPRKDGGEQVGDVVVIGARYRKGGSRPHAVVTTQSVETRFENVTLYASPTFGFFETSCSGSVYLNCTIDRRAGRMRSLNADAFHSKFASVGPQIIGCKAMWQGDDCVNICGDYHVVSKTSRDSIRVLAKRALDIQPDDSLELVNAEGQRLPDAKVLSIKPAGNTMEEELEQLKELRIRNDTIRFMKKAYVIRLDREIDLPFGSLVGSLNRRGNGFAVKDCNFGNVRSRGILIKASNGEVSGNRVENCQGEGIKIAPELYWLESGYSRNLIISNNTVINSGEEALLIEPISENGSGFEQIMVTGNRFSGRHQSPVSYPSEGVKFINNTVNGVE